MEAVQTMRKLRAYVERLRAAELDKCLSKMGDNLSNQTSFFTVECSILDAMEVTSGLQMRHWTKYMP